MPPFGLDLRIVAVFEMFIASLFGVYVPYYLLGGKEEKDDHSELFIIMRSISASIMLSVAMVRTELVLISE